tara:strand:- start:4777 stop:5124 length:348 start_codon:yes stop_codon:yes gene_type:complete
MSKINEDKLENEVVIDFNQLRDPELKESFLASFGNMVKGLLKAIFGSGPPPKTTVMGKPKEIDAFAKALRAERGYLSTLQKYDLDHPRTHRNKAKLKNSVKKFERDTGVKWPFEV